MQEWSEGNKKPVINKFYNRNDNIVAFLKLPTDVGTLREKPEIGENACNLNKPIPIHNIIIANHPKFAKLFIMELNNIEK